MYSPSGNAFVNIFSCAAQTTEKARPARYSVSEWLLWNAPIVQDVNMTLKIKLKKSIKRFRVVIAPSWSVPELLGRATQGHLELSKIVVHTSKKIAFQSPSTVCVQDKSQGLQRDIKRVKIKNNP